MENVEIVRDRNAGRFELRAQGQRIGAIDYVPRGSQIVLTHTQVSEDYSGQGLAATLVEAALQDVRANGESVVPDCAYVRGYIRTHPQWSDLDATQQGANA